MTFLQYNVAVFLAVGLGYAVTMFLATELSGTGGAFGSNSAFVGAGFALAMGLMMSPLIAAINGAVIGLRYQEGRKLVSANSFVGSGVGVVVMAVVLFVSLAIFSPGGGDGGGGSFPFGPVIGFLIGVGLTGAIATYLTKTIQ
ncbi:MAG: hypothetical protein ACI9YT_000675 [Halobacteriales archaeon]|jgi:hypothetical protein